MEVKLSVLINISAFPDNMPESFSTLGFSTNCKKIKNKIFLPYQKVKSSQSMMVKDLQDTINVQEEEYKG